VQYQHLSATPPGQREFGPHHGDLGPLFVASLLPSVVKRGVVPHNRHDGTEETRKREV
jgi:hypothetical protein